MWRGCGQEINTSSLWSSITLPPQGVWWVCGDLSPAPRTGQRGVGEPWVAVRDLSSRMLCCWVMGQWLSSCGSSAVKWGQSNVLVGLVDESPMRQGCVRGDQGFLPDGTRFLFKSQAAIARYSGWQIAYILWGKCHHVTHSIQHTLLPGHLWSLGGG